MLIIEGSGPIIQDICLGHQISEQTFYRLKRELGMLEISQAEQLKELQPENARLKRMLADEIPLVMALCFTGLLNSNSSTGWLRH